MYSNQDDDSYIIGRIVTSDALNRDLNPYFRVGIQKGMSDDEELPLHDMASLVFSMAYPFLLLYNYIIFNIMQIFLLRRRYVVDKCTLRDARI